MPSVKNGFCIADSDAIDPSLPHAGDFAYSPSNCLDPTATVGISVGWSDKYDFNDPGQAIGLTNVPDGVYWFRHRIDPNNYLTLKDPTHNVLDVKLQIAGDTVTVRSPLTTVGAIHADATVFADGTGPLTTPSLSVPTPGALVVAFVAADSPSAQVSGGGLSWTLAARASSPVGTTEVWSARAAGPLVNAEVSVTPEAPDSNQSVMTVIGFSGAVGIGAVAPASAATGRPSTTLATTRAGSAVYAVGHDRTPAILQAPARGQAMVHQWRPLAELERSPCQACPLRRGIRQPVHHANPSDLFWVQALDHASQSAGEVVNVFLDHPRDARWSLTAVEIVASN